MKHAINTVYFHEGTAFHMQGKNFGNRIDVKLGAIMFLDTDTDKIHISYQGKVSGMSSYAVKNWDYAVTPDDVAEYFQEFAPKPKELHPLSRGSNHLVEDCSQEFDPNDDAASHRAKVRAASANSNKGQNGPQTDDLIQAARNAAMGVKTNRVQAQVQNAQQVGANTTGKPKPISHAALAAQVAAEGKE